MLTPLLACSERLALDGTVTDVWGHPVEDATIVVEGVVERHRTDASGRFTLEPPPDVKRVMAGKDGFIKAVQEVTRARDSAGAWEPLTFALYPEPEEPGFYAQGVEDYVHVEPQRIRVLGTDVTSYVGLREVPDEGLPRGPARFVFTSMLKGDELAQMNLHLSRLTFVSTARVKGILGPVDASVNLWTADSDVAFDLIAFPTRNDYLIVTRAALEPGAYAFHAQDVMDEQVMASLPREMQVAFPFIVEG